MPPVTDPERALAEARDAFERQDWTAAPTTLRPPWRRGCSGSRATSDDKLYCVFIADDEATVAEHAELSGFPAHRVSRVTTVVDPTTGGR